MSLLFVDGFEMSDYAIKWGTVFGDISYLSVSGVSPRYVGSKYLYASRYVSTGSTATGLTKSITASSKVTVGVAICTQYSSSPRPRITFLGDGGSVSHITVACNASGILEVRRGTDIGTLIATGTTTLVGGDSSWSYIEAQVVVHDTSGTVEVRVNGNPNPDISYTGDTRNSGVGVNIDAISLSGCCRNAPFSFDDVYILNSEGTINNTFLGDMRIATLSPNDNGSYSQFTGSDGDSTDNYVHVDDTDLNTSDYVESDTIGDKDSYLMTDLPSGVTNVYGLQINNTLARTEGGSNGAIPFVRIGSTDYSTTPNYATTTYSTQTSIYETNPATSSNWTPAEVNSIETGIEIGGS